MATVPGPLIWEIVKKKNSFLVKEFGNGSLSVQFSKESNNLYNLNSYKHSGLADTKTVTIQAGGKDQSVLLATTKTKKQGKPASSLHKSVMKEFNRMAKAVRNQEQTVEISYSRSVYLQRERMMESPPQEKSVDETVGRLVWVRRRNGSWWPGQIIDMGGCSEDFTPFRKSGTPIKLLGREDTIVGWFNLEKTKRVKPFRSVEFADCIEKAKLDAANSAKKAVKYVRKVDAILPALDIELEQSNGDSKPAPTVSL